MKLFLTIIFSFIAILHLSLISLASSASFSSNHTHLNINEFNDHSDLFEESTEVRHHHKHKHNQEDTEHEHSHLLSLEHKDLFYTDEIIFNCQIKHIIFQISKNTNTLKLSNQNSDIFRPPIKFNIFKVT